MSDLAPPAGTPPPQFVTYPRGESTSYGSVERLQALGEGYFGLNTVFLVNVGFFFGFSALSKGGPGGAIGDLVNGVGLLFGLSVIAILFYRESVKIGYGKGWSKAVSVLAAVLGILNAVLFCGILGYFIMQAIAMGEMRKYGLKGQLGLKKKDWQAMVALMQQNQATPAAFTPPPPQV